MNAREFMNNLSFGWKLMEHDLQLFQAWQSLLWNVQSIESIKQVIVGPVWRSHIHRRTCSFVSRHGWHIQRGVGGRLEHSSLSYHRIGALREHHIRGRTRGHNRIPSINGVHSRRYHEILRKWGNEFFFVDSERWVFSASFEVSFDTAVVRFASLCSWLFVVDGTFRGAFWGFAVIGSWWLLILLLLTLSVRSVRLEASTGRRNSWFIWVLLRYMMALNN